MAGFSRDPYVATGILYCMRVRRTAAAPKRLRVEFRTVWARASQLYENANRTSWVDGRDALVELGSVQETYSLIVANHWY
jgi:hypothetical protein